MQSEYEHRQTKTTQNSVSQQVTQKATGKSPAAKPSAGNSTLTFSEQGISFLKNKEGLRLKPYDDQTGKSITKWVKGATIGYGKLINESEWPIYKNGISEEGANQLLKQKLVLYENAVNRSIHVPLNQHQYDALVIFAYNIGPASFANSSAVKIINNPAAKTPYSSLENAWKAFNKSQGKVNNGLNNRREAEWQMFNQGNSKSSEIPSKTSEHLPATQAPIQKKTISKDTASTKDVTNLNNTTRQQSPTKPVSLLENNKQATTHNEAENAVEAKNTYSIGKPFELKIKKDLGYMTLEGVNITFEEKIAVQAQKQENNKVKNNNDHTEVSIGTYNELKKNAVETGLNAEIKKSIGNIQLTGEGQISTEGAKIAISGSTVKFTILNKTCELNFDKLELSAPDLKRKKLAPLTYKPSIECELFSTDANSPSALTFSVKIEFDIKPNWKKIALALLRLVARGAIIATEIIIDAAIAAAEIAGAILLSPEMLFAVGVMAIAVALTGDSPHLPSSEK